MLKLSDGRNFGRTLTGLCLIAGPILLLIAQLVSPDVSDNNKVKELADVAAHKGSYLVGGLIFMVAGLVLLGAAIGLIHLFRGRRVTLGQVAGSLLALGSAASVAFYAFTTVEYEMVNISGLDRTQMARLLDKGQESAAALPLFLVFVVGIVIGLILLGIAAWRRHVVPVWAGIALIVGGVLAFAGGDSKVINIVDFAVLVVGLGSIGLAVLSMSDEEWDAPREAAAATPVEPIATPALPVT
jgi:Domain of unknown function (DUF4386)